MNWSLFWDTFSTTVPNFNPKSNPIITSKQPTNIENRRFRPLLTAASSKAASNELDSWPFQYLSLLTKVFKKSPNFQFRSGIDHATKVKMRHWSLLTSVFPNSVTCALKDKMSSGTLTLSIAPHRGNTPTAFAKDSVRHTNTCPFNTSPPSTSSLWAAFYIVGFLHRQSSKDKNV